MNLAHSSKYYPATTNNYLFSEKKSIPMNECVIDCRQIELSVSSLGFRWNCKITSFHLMNIRALLELTYSICQQQISNVILDLQKDSTKINYGGHFFKPMFLGLRVLVSVLYTQLTVSRHKSDRGNNKTRLLHNVIKFECFVCVKVIKCRWSIWKKTPIINYLLDQIFWMSLFKCLPCNVTCSKSNTAINDYCLYV